MSHYPEHEKLDAVGMEKLAIEENIFPASEIEEGEVVSAHVVPAACSEVVYSDPYGNLRLKKLDVDPKTLLLFSTHPLEVELMSQVQEKLKVEAWDSIRIVAPYVASLHESEDVSSVLSQIIADHKQSGKPLSTERLAVIEGLALLSAIDFDQSRIERIKNDIADLLAEVRRLRVVESQSTVAVFELLKQADSLCSMGEGKYDSGAITHQAEILYALERLGLFKVTGSSSYRYIWGELTEAGKEAMLEALEVRYDF